MDTPKIPYTIQAGIAASVNNDEAVLTIMQSVVNDVLHGVVYKYNSLDLPLVLAAVKHAVNGLETLLDEDDKMIEETAMKEIGYVTIDASMIRKLAKKEKDDD